MSAEGAGGSPGPWTGDGCCLITWGSGTGPTFAADPEGKPIKEKLLGTCEIWRAIDPESGGPAVCIGETDAEAFLDEHIANGSRATYWVMEKAAGGGLRQVGPTIDVEMPGRAGASADVTPPTPPDDLRAVHTSKGNRISWLPSSDDESGVLAYFIYSANEQQPDAVLWVDEENDRVRKTDAHRLEWTDETTDANKPYIIRAIDRALNLSDPTGKAIPTPGKSREPVEPVVPVRGNTIGDDFVMNQGTVGDGCAIGGGVDLATGNVIGDCTTISDRTTTSGGVRIGTYCVIGSDVHILVNDYVIPDGTTVADGTIVRP
jgi:acetyltransferase-like isoleucine patch superfamily enzyme